MSALDHSTTELAGEITAPGPAALSLGAAWTNLSTVSAAHAVIHATVVLMPLVYPILHDQYHFSYTDIGLLVAVPSLVGGLLQLAFGYLGRFLARKTMIGVGNLLVGLSMFLTGTTSAYPLFMGWQILGRIGGAPQHPVASGLLTDTFGSDRRGFALAAHVAGGNLGTIAVPLMGAALIHHLGWQPTLMLFALPGLVAGAAVLLFVHDPAGGTAPAPVPAGRRIRRFDVLLAPLRSRGVLVIIFASMVAAGGRGVGILTTYLPLYLADRRHGFGLAQTAVALLFTLLLVGSVVGPLVGGRLSDLVGRRLMLLLSYGPAAFFTALLPLLNVRAPSVALLVTMVALLGLTAYAESPLLQAYLADHAPAGLQDAAFGWYFTLAFGVGSLWGAALGFIIDHAGFPATFWTMAGSYVLAGLVVLAVPASPRQRMAVS